MQRTRVVAYLTLLAGLLASLAPATSFGAATLLAEPSGPTPPRSIWLPLIQQQSEDDAARKQPKPTQTPPGATPGPTQTALPTSAATSSPVVPTATPNPGAVLAVDSFTAPDNTIMSQHASDNGLAWSVHQGTWKILGNEAQNSTGPAYASVDVGTGNVMVEADITTPPNAPGSGSDWFVGFYAAAKFNGIWIDSGVQLRMLYQNHSSEFEMWEWHQGKSYLANSNVNFNFANVTVPNASDPNQPFQPGKTHHIGLQVFGDTAVAYYNGIPTVMMRLGRSIGSDPNSNQTGTRVAISVDGVGIAGSRIDNLRVTRLDAPPPAPSRPVCGDGNCTGGQSCNNCGSCLPPGNVRTCNFNDNPPTVPTYGPWTAPTPDPVVSTPTPAPTASRTPVPTGTPPATPPPGISGGVPQYAVNFNVDVETWWTGHPFNPVNPSYVQVGSITNLPGLSTVNVRQQYGGNLQAAIDALPASGGTLVLDAGSYQSFRLVGKSNVHFVSSGGAVIAGSSSVAPTERALNYTEFNSCSYSKDPACIAALQNQAANIYFKNVTFDGGGSARSAIGLHAVRGVVFDGVTFQNFVNPNTGHGGLVDGNSTLNNVWFREVRFVGSQRYAIYLDGAHGSGVINSIIENGFDNGLLFLTNDDFTLDINGNGALDPAERRIGNYIVVYGNTFRGNNIYSVVQATAANTLVKNNTASGNLTYFASFDFRNSNRGIVYNFYGSRLVNNRTQSLVHFSEWGGVGACNLSLGQTCARMGQYQVRENVVQGAGSFQSMALHDSSTLSQMDGPYTISNNCVNGKLNGTGAACGAGAPISPPSSPVPPTPAATATPPPAPPPGDSVAFPLGVFEDGNFQSSASFGSMIDDLRAHNLDSVYFVNTWARGGDMLNVSDTKGLNVYYNLNEGWDQWFNNNSVSQDIATARSVFYPLVDAVKDHPSLKGYNVLDEPTNNLQTKVNLAVQALQERDPDALVMPTLIGINRADPIFATSRPDVMLLDVYPFATNNAACDTTMNGFGYPTYDFVDYIRAIAKVKDAGTPLWVILQAHSVGDGSEGWHMRAPSPVELREEHWLAIGEGATGIFWFIYSSEQGWVGLKDDPALFAEVSRLAQRIQPLRSLLVTLHKTADQFTATGGGSAYASTLTNANGSASYVVAVNKQCGDQILTVSSISSPKQLKDLESGQVFSTGSPIPFAAGDGRIFEVLPNP